jgi:hypothetical protein
VYTDWSTHDHHELSQWSAENWNHSCKSQEGKPDSLVRQKEHTTMMPTPLSNAMYLVQQHNQDLLREAEADRLYNEAKRGLANPAPRLLAPLQSAMAAIARLGQQGVQEQIQAMEKVQSGAKLPIAKSTLAHS